MAENRSKEADISQLRSITDELLTSASDPSLAEQLGLPQPITIPLDPDVVKKKVEDVYASIFKDINAMLEKEDTSQPTMTDKDTEVMTTPPDLLLHGAIKNVVKQTLREEALVMDTGDEAIDDFHSYDTTKFMQSLSGKGVSPPAGVGHNRQPGRSSSTGRKGPRWSNTNQWW